VIIASLALGIGANTAVFSFVDAVQFKLLPFPDEETLVDVHEWSATELCAGCAVGTSYPGLLDWRARTSSFSEMGAYVENRVVVSGGDPERVGAALVSASLFPLLGVRPSIGRQFTSEEDLTGAEPVAIISDALWKRKFGAEPEILKRTIRVNGIERPIIGVMPPGFRYPEFAHVWLPLAPAAREWKRNDRSLGVVARLRAGVALDQARGEVKAIAAALAQTYPETNKGWTADVSTLRDDMTSETAMASAVLMSAVAFVLVIACANVAGLLLVRASERRREIAMRLALGASRARVVRLVAAESVWLSVIGGAAGLLIALWASAAIVAAIGTEVPYWIQLGIDARVVAFSVGITLMTGLACGLLPALSASRQDPQAILKDGATTTPRRRALHALVVVQLALSVMLLSGAGLLIKTVARTFEFNPGYDPASVIAGDVSLSGDRYQSPARVTAFALGVIQQLERIDGVRAAASRTVFFAGFGGTRRSVQVEGMAVVPAGASPTFYAAITPGYFAVHGISVIQGRGFTTMADDATVIVNETMARRLWGSSPAIGHRIRFDESSTGAWRTVVGVVPDFGGGPLGGERAAFAFVPFETASTVRDVALIASRGTEGTPLIPEMRAAVRAVDPDQPVEDIKTMEAAYADWASPARFVGMLMTALAVIALSLASMGTYGVAAYGVVQRTRELAIRMALGATTKQIGRSIIGGALRLGAAALLVGLPGAWATTRALQGILFGTSPTDAAVFSLAPVILLSVAALAAWHPARRASRVDPIRALRAE
jgi:putative ABC transport system permease protein